MFLFLLLDVSLFRSVTLILFSIVVAARFLTLYLLNTAIHHHIINLTDYTGRTRISFETLEPRQNPVKGLPVENSPQDVVLVASTLSFRTCHEIIFGRLVKEVLVTAVLRILILITVDLI